MGTTRRTDRRSRREPRHVRPTIAYVAPEAVVDSTAIGLWSGVEAGAREQDLNLIAFPGGNIRFSLDTQSGRGQANIIYDFITPEIIEGLVTWAAALQSSAIQAECLTEEELIALHARYHPLPIVTLTKAVPGCPLVTLDSYRGMRDAVAHLIEVHGYRRIAFIRGPENHPAAEARYRAYRDALGDHGIAVNPDLISPAGDWSSEQGSQAVALFLDQRALRPAEDLEAIAAVSDLFALTAMGALQNRGIRIPDDVAIVGFNDSAEARCASPPITSVTAPLLEQGRQAVWVLKRLLEHQPVSEETVIPTKLAIHQSCGCLEKLVVQAGLLSPAAAEEVGLEAGSTTQRETILQEMVRAAGSGRIEPASAEGLLDAMVRAVGGARPGQFLATLRDVLQQVPPAGRGDLAWQDLLSVIQRHAVYWGDTQKVLLLLGQARAALAEISSRARAYQQLQTEKHAQRLRRIGAALIATFDLEGLADVLARELPELGIPSCYLALYEDAQPYCYPQPAPEWSRLLLAYDENGRIALDPQGRRFPTRHIVPQGMLPEHRRYTMVLQPLYFQNSQIGFALFEVGLSDWQTYNILRGEISSALQGALLVQRVQERSAELARQNYILDTFMETVPDCIYFKDLQSRITRASKAHAAHLGLRDPTEEIGKTDLDFFAREEALAKYNQEQEIIRTGQPLLALEEKLLWPDGRVEWMLTSKMPLRDERGNIIGTFGISRDITPLRQAQEALQKAYAEVEKLVEERTAELRREISERKRAEQEIRRQAETLAALHETALDLVAQRSAPSLLGAIVRRAVHLLDAKGGGIYLYRPHTEDLELVLQFGPVPDLTGTVLRRGEGLSGRVLEEGRPMAVVNHGQGEGTAEPFREGGGEASVSVPICWGGRMLGVLNLVDDSPRTFTSDDIALLERFTPLAAAALENTRLYNDLQQQMEELRYAQDQLIRSAKMAAVGELAAGVAHELNNPLTSVLGFAHLMMEDLAPDSPLRGDLEKIAAHATRAREIVQNLLSFARPQEPQLHEVELNKVLQQTLAVMSDQIGDSNVVVEEVYDPDVGALALDEGQIKHLFLNLITNAIQAMPEGGTLTVRTARAEGGTTVSISDTGVGIQPENQDRLFEPFFTTKPTRAGLGLSVSLAIARAHGGRITVQSEAGRGSTFTVWLPTEAAPMRTTGADSTLPAASHLPPARTGDRAAK